MIKTEIKNKILRSGQVEWKKLNFIQQDKFKKLTKEAKAKLK